MNNRNNRTVRKLPFRDRPSVRVAALIVAPAVVCSIIQGTVVLLFHSAEGLGKWSTWVTPHPAEWVITLVVVAIIAPFAYLFVAAAPVIGREIIGRVHQWIVGPKQEWQQHTEEFQTATK